VQATRRYTQQPGKERGVWLLILGSPALYLMLFYAANPTLVLE